MKKASTQANVREGTLPGDLPYLALGQGPPLVIFPGLGPSNALTTGLQRQAELQYLAPLARTFTVYSVNRRVGLATGATHADFADDYAEAIRATFEQPVDVLGFSTGGHTALQFAINHPELVRRLILVATAYRLSPIGLEASRQCAELAAVGQYRRAFAALTPAIIGSPMGQRLAGSLQWFVTPLFLGRDWNPNDMIVTLRADLVFDVGDLLKSIKVPTLVIGGAFDPSYPPKLVQQTAARIPHARLLIYPRSHGGVLLDRQLTSDVVGFLMAKDDAFPDGEIHEGHKDHQ